MDCSCGRRKCTCQSLCTGEEGCLCFPCSELNNKKCALCGFQILAVHFSGGNSEANEESDICRCFLWGDQDINISNEEHASADLPTVSIAGPSDIPESNPAIVGVSLLSEGNIFSSQITIKQSEVMTTFEDKPRKDGPLTEASNRSHKAFPLSTEKDLRNLPKGKTNLSEIRENGGKSEPNEANVKDEELTEKLQGIAKADKTQKNETFTTTSSILFQQNFGINLSKLHIPLHAQNYFNLRFQRNLHLSETIYMGIQPQSIIQPYPHTYAIPVLNSSIGNSSHPHQQNDAIPVFNRSAENSFLPPQQNDGIPFIYRSAENSFLSHQQNDGISVFNRCAENSFHPPQQNDGIPVFNPSAENSFYPYQQNDGIPVFNPSAENSFHPCQQNDGILVFNPSAENSFNPYQQNYGIPVFNPSAENSFLSHQQNDGISVFNRCAENSFHPHQQNEGIPILNRLPENSSLYHPQNNLQQRSPRPTANGSSGSLFPYHIRNPNPMELPQIRPFQMIPGRPYGIARCQNSYSYRTPHVVSESATRQELETSLMPQDFLAEGCRPTLSTRSTEIRELFAELPFANESTSNEEDSRSSTSPCSVNDTDSSNENDFLKNSLDFLLD